MIKKMDLVFILIQIKDSTPVCGNKVFNTAKALSDHQQVLKEKVCGSKVNVLAGSMERILAVQ